jgi:hypothetical protein
MFVVTVVAGLLLAYMPPAGISEDRPDQSPRDWLRNHFKSIVAGATAYGYYVGAVWMAGADVPHFLRDHLFDGLAPAALVGILIDFYPRADPVVAFPRIRYPFAIPIMFYIAGVVIFGLIAMGAVFSSGENDYVSVVPLTAGYGGALFPVAYVTQVGGPVTSRGETPWARAMWWFRARPADQPDRRVTTLTGHAKRVWAVAIAPDGTWLATAGGDGTARIWCVDGTLHATLAGHKGTVRAVAIAPDGTWLATASHDGTARIWAADGTLRATLTGHAKWVWAVAIAPDGTWLATAGLDTTARIWTADGTLRATFGYRGQVPALAIAPDGTWLATASGRTTQIWAVDGTLRATLTGHKKQVCAVAIAPDATWLATASLDTTARIWRV